MKTVGFQSILAQYVISLDEACDSLKEILFMNTAIGDELLAVYKINFA